LLVAMLSPAAAQQLRIGVAALATTIDPHFQLLAANITLSVHVYDSLVARTADAGLAPGLALSWQPIDERTWEFKLRPGVKWHDGADFTAEDVAFTVWRARTVPNSPSSFAIWLKAIARVEVVDPLTVRFRTVAPAPNLPSDLTPISIVSRHAGATAATEDYNSGKAAIGTGAYRLARFVRGARIELDRNDDWWGTRPEWARVILIAIPNPAARVAALLAGDVDMIDAPPLNGLADLRGDKRVAVFSGQGLRVIFAAPDFSRTGPSPFVTDAAGVPLPRNPLRDRRVREALSLAINRPALAERVMHGAAAPTGQWMPPGAFGHVAELAVPPFDPERARALLAEAGYPAGFRLTFHAPNDRFPSDSALAQAVAQMWTRVGVRTSVDVTPGVIYSPRGFRHDYAMGVWSWSNGTGEVGYVLTNVLGSEAQEAGRGAINVAGYSDPGLDALVESALATFDPTLRRERLEGAVSRAVGDLAYLPLLHIVNSWACRAGLVYEPRADELTMAMGVRRRPGT
jgi:peptide/nickel transport system substrate-binding protein